MKKGIILSILLLVAVATTSQALYIYCAGVVKDSQGYPEPDVYVVGWALANPEVCGTDYSASNGYFELNSSVVPHIGYYTLCATKSGEGQAATTKYKATEEDYLTWFPYLSSPDGNCNCETPPNDR